MRRFRAFDLEKRATRLLEGLCIHVNRYLYQPLDVTCLFSFALPLVVANSEAPSTNAPCCYLHALAALFPLLFEHVNKEQLTVVVRAEIGVEVGVNRRRKK